MTENYYKEFYSSEFVNNSLGDSEEDEDEFIIAGQNVSYQDSICST